MMKLAIMLYGTRVSPRFGYSDGVLIVEVNKQKEIDRKTMEVRNYFPEQIPEILDEAGVQAVISGGMNHRFQNLFRVRGIEVIWGIIGEADDALTAFSCGQLTPGMGFCPSEQKRKKFRGRNYGG
jgi:predicted Fe-Mo cluster-binding NifX family protein